MVKSPKWFEFERFDKTKLLNDNSDKVIVSKSELKELKKLADQLLKQLNSSI
jgi:hypothetical protein